MRNTYISLGVGLLALLFLACGDTGTIPTGPPTPVATSIALSATNLSFTFFGQKEQLSATVKDQNGATISVASVSWISSTPSVAIVSSEGLVTAVANGTAAITATQGNATGTATVTVEQVPTSISLAKPSILFRTRGDTARIIFSVLDSGSSKIADATVTWASSDESVATVSPEALLTAVEDGIAEVTAESGSASSMMKVTVNSQDGSKLLVGIAGGAAVMDVSTQELDVVFENASLNRSAISPSGNEIALFTPSELRVASMETGAQRTILGVQSFYSPGWTPSGDSILVRPKQGGLWLLSSEDGNGRTVAHIGGGPWGTSLDHSPAFSPDGKWIAFTGFVSDPSRLDRMGLYAVRRDGSDLRILTDSTFNRTAQAGWSPDGKKVYFALNTLCCRDTGIYRVDLDTFDSDKIELVIKTTWDSYTMIREGTYLQTNVRSGYPRERGIYEVELNSLFVTNIPIPEREGCLPSRAMASPSGSRYAYYRGTDCSTRPPTRGVFISDSTGFNEVQLLHPGAQNPDDLWMSFYGWVR